MKSLKYLILAVVAILPAAPAAATPPAESAVVALGDSIASGEGAGDYATDGDPDCHRSANAELAVAGITDAKVLNLACSGATTTDVVSGDGSQLNQLREAARQYRIKMVLVTVGSNDIGFREIVTDCALRYLRAGDSCQADWAPKVEERLAALQPTLERTLGAIRGVLAGERQYDYRLVVQSYPDPLPVENRFQTRFSRLLGGCPFQEDDARWARERFVPQIAHTMKLAARALGAEFLDLTYSMDGHEVCSTGPGPKWTHGISISLKEGQPEAGISRESLHPNRDGHAALGGCLGQFWVQRGNGFCDRDGDTLRFRPVPFERA